MKNKVKRICAAAVSSALMLSVISAAGVSAAENGDGVWEFDFTTDTDFSQEQILGTDFEDGLYDITFTKQDSSRYADIYVNGAMVANNVDRSGYNRTVSSPASVTVHDIEVTDGTIAVSMEDTKAPYLSSVRVERADGERKTKVFVIGDSLVANYYGDTDDENKAQSGWGQVLDDFLSDDVEVVNLANGGHYASILYETAFPGVLAHGKEGDYVIIECGYNDTKYNPAASVSEIWFVSENVK